MRRTALVVLVVLATASCTLASPSPSPVASTRQTSAPSSSPVASTRQTADTPEPSAAASPLEAPPVQEVQLPNSGVETLSLANLTKGSKPVRNMYQDASLFLFSIGQTVYGYQFGKADGPDVMDTAQGNDQVLGIDGGQADLVWAIGHYDQSTGRVPCADAGALTWWLVPSNPIDMIHPQFVNSRIRLCTAAPPMFAMDGMKLAIATEAPRDGHPLAWEIRVTSELNDTPLRTIETDGDLFGLDLSGDDVAYVEGDYEATEDAPTEYNTRLMLSTADDPDPVEIAKNAYDVSFSGGRLAWLNDPRSSQRDQGAQAPSLMTASTTDHTPRVLTTDLGTRFSSPVASADNLTWTVNGHVFLWDVATNFVGRIEGTGNADQASARNGWLTWLGDDANEVQSLNAIELATIFPPVPTPIPTSVAPPSPAWTPYLSSPAPKTQVVDGVSWLRLDSDSLYNFDSFGVWPSRGRWLGVGTHSICPSFCVGQESWLLESADAVSWSILGELPPAPIEGLGVTETDFGFFAYGTLDEYGPSDHPAMWHSMDGVHWSSLSDEPSFAPGQCGSDSREEISSMYETSSGLVAMGSATWFSADGEIWTCSDQPSLDVRTLGTGFVGFEYGTDGVTIWLSDDGINWRKTGVINGFVDVEPVSNGFVAVTQGDPRDGTFQPVYTSPDGKTWTELRYPFRPAYVESLTSDGTRAAAVDESDPAIWLSAPDGSHWKRYELPTQPGEDLNGVVQDERTVIVSGNAAGRASTVLWVAQIP